MRLILCVLLTLFCSCPTVDTSAQIAANSGMEKAFLSTSQAFEKFVNHPAVKIDVALRDAIMENLNKDRAAFNVFKVGSDAWAKELGSMSPEAIQKMLDEVIKIYNLVKENV